MQKILTKLFVLLAAITLPALAYIDNVSPKNQILTNREIDDKHLAIINELSLLGHQESIRYFYSSAIIDIRNDLLLATDEQLILYNKNLDKPLKNIHYKEITNIDIKNNILFITLYNNQHWKLSLPKNSSNQRALISLIKTKSNHQQPSTTNSCRVLNTTYCT